MIDSLACFQGEAEGIATINMCGGGGGSGCLPPPRLVLASASPRRSALLRQVGAAFDVFYVEVDETEGPMLPPAQFAIRAALKKARAAAAAFPQHASEPRVFVGADTIVVPPNGQILGKPSGRDDACRMLGLLAGRWHEVVTGVAAVCWPEGAEAVEYETTRVRMCAMDGDAIRRYVGTGDADGKAGAYAIQGMGALLVESVDGCYNNVVGLPLRRLAIMLEAFGLNLLV